MSSYTNTNTTTNIINPKSCNYNCGTRIYWDNSSNSYLEVFTNQKHICKNRPVSNNNNNNDSKSSTNLSNNNNYKPSYYNKFSKQPKPKMDNSLEVLQGSIAEVKSKYEILTDLIKQYNGKTHGSQFHIMQNQNSSMSLIVYFEVPEGKREEIKQKLENFARTILPF